MAWFCTITLEYLETRRGEAGRGIKPSGGQLLPEHLEDQGFGSQAGEI